MFCVLLCHCYCSGKRFVTAVGLLKVLYIKKKIKNKYWFVFSINVRCPWKIFWKNNVSICVDIERWYRLTVSHSDVILEKQSLKSLLSIKSRTEPSHWFRYLNKKWAKIKPINCCKRNGTDKQTTDKLTLILDYFSTCLLIVASL